MPGEGLFQQKDDSHIPAAASAIGVRLDGRDELLVTDSERDLYPLVGIDYRLLLAHAAIVASLFRGCNPPATPMIPIGLLGIASLGCHVGIKWVS